MPESLFQGLFDSDLTAVISVYDFILCLSVSLILGLAMTFTYMYRTRYTKSFVVTLALLPAVVCVVIMLVNGNVGTGVAVAGPTQGDTATLDYDTTAEITGGTFIGTGASGMAQTFSDSGQGVIAVSVGEQSAGTGITLTDQNGNEIISYTPELSFAVVILSTPDITSGETYTITVGEASGEFEAS